MAIRFQPGDVVVYRKLKTSLRPGPNAREVQAAAHGDSYTYFIDKFWRVVAQQPDHTLVVRTRRGKQLTIPADDPNLRRAYWWEWLLFARRFPPSTPLKNEPQP